MNRKSESASRRVAREVATSIFFGGLAPYVVYRFASPYLGEVPSLLVGAFVPGVFEVVSFVGHRKLDPLTTLNLAGIALSVILAAIGGGTRAVLVRESFVGGAVGLGFLVSLAGARPAIYHLGRQFAAGNDPARVARYEEAWEASPAFRASVRKMTVVWGIALVAELATRAMLVTRLTTEQMLVAGPVVFYAVLFALIAWTVRESRRLPRARAACLARSGESPATPMVLAVTKEIR
jgi:hypothetical protein